MKKYYLVELKEDKFCKPRYYASDEDLTIGSWVYCYQRNDSKLGLVVGRIETAERTIKKLVNQLNGTYPLVKCGTKQKKSNDIFVLTGICKKGESPIDLLDKAIEQLKEEGYENKKEKN